MLQTRTRRRTTSPPPDSGPHPARLRASAAILLGLLLPACTGSNETENRIKPIQATLAIDPFPGTPDPAVYFEKVSTTGDLVTVNVKLHTSGTPISFDAFTLEIAYDFNLIQIGDVFDVNPALLGGCGAGTACDPQCLNNASQSNRGDPNTLDVNGKAHFLMGVAALPGCATASVTSDTTLVTLAFIAATTIDPPGSRIELISGSGPGDCEILSNVADVGVPCVDGNATMTATR